jgi:anaerobic magnesium-protoporphyrin IX monomethyl ester cyclase
MRILLCNPRNSQGTKHSRKGMYVPLGILSIATCLKEKFRDAVHIDVYDEDVEELQISIFDDYDLVGFYSTTFNYAQAVRYAYLAKDHGCVTVLGGPHPTVLAKNILRNRNCFDYVIRFEAEYPFTKMVEVLLSKENQSDLGNIPNLAYRDTDGSVIVNSKFYENVLADLPIPSRDFVRFDLYVENYRKVYPEKVGVRPGSIYSSKGCSWRDKTGGCIFCARLEEGVRFRDIGQIWAEVEMLQEKYGVNSIWDIADDNLNNKEWFVEFVKKRPKSCRDLRFFIYSRASCIKPWVIDYFTELNVEEVFLGIESGDNRLLRMAFKGQTREMAYRALKMLNDNKIRFYPSFVLGLPGESEESLNNTLDLCREIADLGGLDRMAATILKPIPGAKAYDRVLDETRFGQDLAGMDDVDLGFLEQYWIDRFTEVSYETIEEYRSKIDELMSPYHVFGSPVDDTS